MQQYLERKGVPHRHARQWGRLEDALMGGGDERDGVPLLHTAAAPACQEKNRPNAKGECPTGEYVKYVIPEQGDSMFRGGECCMKTGELSDKLAQHPRTELYESVLLGHKYQQLLRRKATSSQQLSQLHMGSAEYRETLRRAIVNDAKMQHIEAWFRQKRLAPQNEHYAVNLMKLYQTKQDLEAERARKELELRKAETQGQTDQPQPVAAVAAGGIGELVQSAARFVKDNPTTVAAGLATMVLFRNEIKAAIAEIGRAIKAVVQRIWDSEVEIFRLKIPGALIVAIVGFIYLNPDTAKAICNPVNRVKLNEEELSSQNSKTLANVLNWVLWDRGTKTTRKATWEDWGVVCGPVGKTMALLLGLNQMGWMPQAITGAMTGAATMSKLGPKGAMVGAVVGGTGGALTGQITAQTEAAKMIATAASSAYQQATQAPEQQRNVAEIDRLLIAEQTQPIPDAARIQQLTQMRNDLVGQPMHEILSKHAASVGTRVKDAVQEVGTQAINVIATQNADLTQKQQELQDKEHALRTLQSTLAAQEAQGQHVDIRDVQALAALTRERDQLQQDIRDNAIAFAMDKGTAAVKQAGQQASKQTRRAGRRLVALGKSGRAGKWGKRAAATLQPYVSHDPEESKEMVDS